MKTQNQIKRQLSQPEALNFLNELLDASDNLKITQLSDKLCEHFSFFNPLGKKQLTCCQVALRQLEQAGLIALRQSLHKRKRSPRRLTEPLPKPQTVPVEAGELLGLELLLVETEKQMRIWNEMMLTDHLRGAGILVGRQVRYLVQSDHGWLGGFWFSSAALHLEDRDKWIGWDIEERKAHLHQVFSELEIKVLKAYAKKNTSVLQIV